MRGFTCGNLLVFKSLPRSVPILDLHCRAPQDLADTPQLVKTLVPVWDLTDHPGLEHLAVASSFCKTYP